MIKLSINLDLSCSKILLCLACGVSVAVCANYICSANKNNRACQKNQESLNPAVEKTHKEKRLEPAVEKSSDVIESNGELSSARKHY